MKQTLLLLLLCNFIFAQEPQTELVFNTPYYEAVDQWVVLPKTDDGTYSYGFIYIDQQAGFTFNYEKRLRITDKGIVNVENDELKSSSFKIRLDLNYPKIAVLSKAQQEVLQLPAEPEWLATYKADEHTAAYKLQIGYIYNHVGASHKAIQPLEEVYAIDSEFRNTAFELGYAYNAIKEYAKAQLVLEKALETHHDDVLLIKELGYTLWNSGKLEKADEVYRKGIALDTEDIYKAEMAINMAQAYYFNKNKEKFKEWAALTRTYATENAAMFLNALKQMETNWID